MFFIALTSPHSKEIVYSPIESDDMSIGCRDAAFFDLFRTNHVTVGTIKNFQQKINIILARRTCLKYKCTHSGTIGHISIIGLHVGTYQNVQ